MGDGDTYDTAAIQAAIDDCAKHPEGGVVIFEENGRYHSAQIVVKSGVRLRLPKTTTLLAGIKVASLHAQNADRIVDMPQLLIDKPRN